MSSASRPQEEWEDARRLDGRLDEEFPVRGDGRARNSDARSSAENPTRVREVGSYRNDGRDEFQPDTAGFSGLVRSFGYALVGIGRTVTGERNMKIHVVFAVAAIVACAVLQCQPMEWCIVIVLIVLVLAAELINTAIEATVDLETQGRRHPLAKKAKDAAAGAVLVLAIGAVLVGLTIYITALIRLLQ